MPLRKGKRRISTIEGSDRRDHSYHTQPLVVHAHEKSLNYLVHPSSLIKKGDLPICLPGLESGKAHRQVCFLDIRQTQAGGVGCQVPCLADFPTQSDAT